MKVHAAAGSGKTWSLIAKAAARPRARTLYLAFNRAIKRDAEQKFGGNVTCATSHGLAYPLFGVPYQAAGLLVPKIRANEVAEALDLHWGSDFNMHVADAVLQALARFLSTDATDFDEAAIARQIVPDSKLEPEVIASLARTLWTRMSDPTDSRIGMVHDGYLKLYSLSRPQLPWDVILFDEYQDANPVTAALVAAQSCARVYVGDESQAIYGFRGAVNAMRNCLADETLHLTKSFRFGQGIADAANALLSNLKGARHPITGTQDRSRIGQFAVTEPHMFIARANGTVFDEAARLISRGHTVDFVGGIERYRIGEVLDAYNLFAGQKQLVQSPYLKAFRSFDALDEYAVVVDDKELKGLVNAVKRHGHSVPDMVSLIRAGSGSDTTGATVKLATAHKSKGLEHDSVRLADDFMPLIGADGAVRKIDPSEHEEVHAVYVALTRARRSLSPFTDLQKLLDIDRSRSLHNGKPAWAQPLPDRRSGINPLAPR
ncbi:UvrD-helicase domain-containing protein [Variovorax sp. LT1P1]|uniref:UvrD-helicase domain-containing protein n=1 Tax=Variovorax sp. LT1P1 TaxID=3443730 RepID=UPI003F4829D2